MNSKIRTAGLICAIAFGGLAIGSLAHAADPAVEARDARPTAATTEPMVTLGPDEGVARGGMGGQRRFRGDPTKEKDWDAALAFGKTNSPLRTKAVTDLQDNNPVKQRLEGMVLFNYQNTIRLKSDTDHELFDVVVNRIQIEDAIFGLAAENQKNPGDASLKAKMRDQVAKFVDVNLKERQLRLDRLKKTIADEQAKLEQDNNPGAKSALVETAVQAALKGDLQPFAMHGPRGGNGGRRTEEPGPPAEPKPQ